MAVTAFQIGFVSSPFTGAAGCRRPLCAGGQWAGPRGGGDYALRWNTNERPLSGIRFLHFSLHIPPFLPSSPAVSQRLSLSLLLSPETNEAVPGCQSKQALLCWTKVNIIIKLIFTSPSFHILEEPLGGAATTVRYYSRVLIQSYSS